VGNDLSYTIRIEAAKARLSYEDIDALTLGALRVKGNLADLAIFKAQYHGSGKVADLVFATGMRWAEEFLDVLA